MAQGGLHRGVAVCKGAPGLPVAQPFPGLVLLSLLPQPLHRVSVHRCIMGWGPSTRNGALSNARPGLELRGEPRGDRGAAGATARTCRYGAHSPGRWHLPAAQQSGSP